MFILLYNDGNCFYNIFTNSVKNYWYVNTFISIPSLLMIINDFCCHFFVLTSSYLSHLI